MKFYEENSNCLEFFSFFINYMKILIDTHLLQ